MKKLDRVNKNALLCILVLNKHIIRSAPEMTILLNLIMVSSLMRGNGIDTVAIPRHAQVEMTEFSRRIDIKTNALMWTLTIMNAECETSLHPHISVAIGLAWCPWFISDRFAVRSLAILPEGKWWLNTNHTGHFFGIHAGTAWYNIKSGDYRYQDTGTPLVNAGVSYGYRLMFSGRFGLEFSLGAGFVSLRYNRYHNIANGASIDTRKTSWFGIDRAAVTISYRLTP